MGFFDLTMSKILTDFVYCSKLTHMIEERILQELGLTDIEAKIYIASLELGSDTVLRIAKKAEIKRPTAYVVLDNLADQGYVSKVETDNKIKYTAEDPTVILNKYKETVANFTDMLPFFRAKFNKGPKPKIRYYEGKEALYGVYTKIIYPSEVVLFFGVDFSKLNNKIPGVLDVWEKVIKKPKKDYREIIAQNKAGIDFAKRNKKTKIFRLMPKDLPVFGDAAITDDKLFIVSLDNLFGVLIESEDLAKTFKNFFELAWRGAEPIK